MTTHGNPPCGTARVFALGRTGLNLAIKQNGIACDNSEHMTRRRFWMWTPLAFAACTTNVHLVDPFPETIANVWRRTEIREVPASEAPDPVPRTTILKLWSAKYEGPGHIEARAYALQSSAVGLDLVQHWHPSADTVFINPGRYFVVVRWQDADRKALQDFIRDLQTRLG